MSSASCPHCGIPVWFSKDGLCPSCRKDRTLPVSAEDEAKRADNLAAFQKPRSTFNPSHLKAPVAAASVVGLIFVLRLLLSVVIRLAEESGAP